MLTCNHQGEGSFRWVWSSEPASSLQRGPRRDLTERSQLPSTFLPSFGPFFSKSVMWVACSPGPDSEKTRSTRRPVNRQVVHAQPTTPATNQGCFVRIYKGQRSQEVETRSRGKWLPKGNSRRGPKRPPATSRGVLQKLGAAFPGPHRADV